MNKSADRAGPSAPSLECDKTSIKAPLNHSQSACLVDVIIKTIQAVPAAAVHSYSATMFFAPTFKYKFVQQPASMA